MSVQPFNSVQTSIYPQIPSRFEQLKKNSPFFSKVEGLLSDANLSKVMEGEDRECEVLLSDKSDPLGLIVYKKKLFTSSGFDRCLEVRSFKLCNHIKSQEEVIEDCLLKHVLALAEKFFAKGITFEVSDNSPLMKFFISRNFKVVKNSSESNEHKLLHLPISCEKEKASLHFDYHEKTKRKIQDSLEGCDQDICGLKKTKLDIQQEKVEKLSANELGSREVGRARQLEHKQPPPKTHKLPMKGTIYFEYIMSGKKKFEGRVFAQACQSMRVGDLLEMFDNRAGWGIVCEISSIDVFRNGFKAMLESKGVLAMLPQLESKASRLSQEELIAEGLKIYNAFPGSQRVNDYGAVAIGVKFLKKI